MAPRDPALDFENIARRPDGQIDLAEAALAVSAAEAPPVDVALYLGRLDELADEARATVARAGNETERIASFNHVFFEKQRFSGNRSDYYDPCNSYLNEVLERRTGIPITLAIAYIAIARRLGLEVRGVGFPGHFLVKHVGTAETLVDPFFGCVLGPGECRERLVEMLGPSAVLQPEIHLRAATEREILVRLLSNLKHIWLRRRDYVRALASCDRILLLAPGTPAELRDRGLVYGELGCADAAIADLERYLAVATDPDSTREVRERIVALRATARTLH